MAKNKKLIKKDPFAEGSKSHSGLLPSDSSDEKSRGSKSISRSKTKSKKASVKELSKGVALSEDSLKDLLDTHSQKQSKQLSEQFQSQWSDFEEKQNRKRALLQADFSDGMDEVDLKIEKLEAQLSALGEGQKSDKSRVLEEELEGVRKQLLQLEMNFESKNSGNNEVLEGKLKAVQERLAELGTQSEYPENDENLEAIREQLSQLEAGAKSSKHHEELQVSLQKFEDATSKRIEQLEQGHEDFVGTGFLQKELEQVKVEMMQKVEALSSEAGSEKIFARIDEMKSELLERVESSSKADFEKIFARIDEMKSEFAEKVVSSSEEQSVENDALLSLQERVEELSLELERFSSEQSKILNATVLRQEESVAVIESDSSQKISLGAKEHFLGLSYQSDVSEYQWMLLKLFFVLFSLFFVDSLLMLIPLLTKLSGSYLLKKLFYILPMILGVVSLFMIRLMSDRRTLLESRILKFEEKLGIPSKLIPNQPNIQNIIQLSVWIMLLLQFLAAFFFVR